MEALYIMIPITLILSGTALAACIWAIQKGQFDDVDTPPLRILHDSEPDDIAPTNLLNKNNAERITT